MKIALLVATGSMLTVTAGCSGTTDAPTPSDAGAAPSVWQSRSSTVDPTKLPLREQYYVSDRAKKGYVFVCEPRMFDQQNGPGAHVGGAWIDAAAGTYDMTKKVFVQGTVFFDNAEFSVTIDGDQRRIAGNGLPVGVPTGTFPVDRNDPAYQYDRNPNAIATQTIAFAIPRNPAVAEWPSCIYKEVGITLDGVQMHGVLDSIGRDELAYQIQDACSGASQPGGGYHRHALSDCTPHIHDKNALVGYALDGFGIFSPYDADGKELTSADLDECHGTTSEIEWEGQRVAMYHYVLTRDFPYTVTCFRGTPTRNAFPALPGAPPQRP